MKLSKSTLRTASVFAGSLLLLSLGMGLYVYYLRATLNTELFTYLGEVARRGVKILNTQVNGDINSLLSASAALTAYDQDKEDEHFWTPLLKEEARHNDFKRMGYVLPSGVAYLSDGFLLDVSHRDYFQKAITGKSAISAPVTDLVDFGESLVMAVPVYTGENITGVLMAAHNLEIYGNLMASKSFNGKGYSLVVTPDGDEIAISAGADTLPTTKNIFTSPRNTHLDKDGSLHRDMKEGKSGTRRFFRDGEGWLYLSYEPIGINDWYLLSVVPEEIAAQKTKMLLWLSLILCGTGLAVFTMLLSYIYWQNKQTRKALYQAAYKDSITHRPNWAKTRQKITALLNAHPDRNYAFVVFEINRFQSINERLGELKANALLQYIATVMDEELQEGETGCRVHSDIFHMLLRYSSLEQLKNRLELFNEKIINWPSLRADCLQIILSFGVYPIRDLQLTASEMLNRAFIAHSTIKGNYSHIIAFYDEAQHQRLRQDLAMESRMEQAVLNKEFSLQLQPIKNQSGTQVAAQARLVWKKPEGKEIPDEVFRQNFNKNGFIVRLDIYMAEEVCQFLKEWKEHNNKSLPLAIEVSADSLRSPYFATVLQQMTRKYGIQPSDLILQITPLTTLEDLPLLTKLVQRLQKEGFKFALNHFVRGNISMDLLKTLPISFIKIEGDFLQDITHNNKTQYLITSLIEMAKIFDVQILFDGVNTNSQWEMLQKLGAEFYCGKEAGEAETSQQLLETPEIKIK